MEDNADEASNFCLIDYTAIAAELCDSIVNENALAAPKIVPLLKAFVDASRSDTLQGDAVLAKLYVALVCIFLASNPELKSRLVSSLSKIALNFNLRHYTLDSCGLTRTSTQRFFHLQVTRANKKSSYLVV
jgi:hypothetical protein